MVLSYIMVKPYSHLKEIVADYFTLEIQDFFIDMQTNNRVRSHILEYAERINTMKTYEDTYPDFFFNLFGCISDESFTTPANLPLNEPEEFE